MQPIWPERSKDTIPSLKSYRLGAVLAYNLCESDTSTNGKEKLYSVLKEIPKKSIVLFCFGEIDCRVHLLKQAEKNNTSLDDITRKCAERYFSAIIPFKDDYKIILWAVIPSTPSETVIDARYPHFGSNRERNEITKIFNSYLKKLADVHGFSFVSIFNDLLLTDGKTNEAFYTDKVHLSQRAMPIAVKRILETLDVSPFIFFTSTYLCALPFRLQCILFTVRSTALSLYYRTIKFLKNAMKKIIFSTLGEKRWRQLTR